MEATSRGSKHAERAVRLRDGGLEWRAVEGEVVVLDLEGSVYLALNHTGAALWEALAASGGATHDELTHCLVDRYGVSREAAEADVGRFLSSLSSHRLLAP